jgi:hypothetical protein
MDILEPETEPAPVPPLTLDQRAMRAPRLFDESKEVNPKTKITLGDIAKAEGVSQVWMGLASFIRQHCPKEAIAVEEGTKTLLDLEPLAQQLLPGKPQAVGKKRRLRLGSFIPDQRVTLAVCQSHNFHRSNIIWTQISSVLTPPR